MVVAIFCGRLREGWLESVDGMCEKGLLRTGVNGVLKSAESGC